MQPSQSHFRILVKGRLDQSWSERLSGMTIENQETHGEFTSVLTGPLTDQSALSGVIGALVDMHFEVLSVDRLANPLFKKS
jgi:hypothetical protein